MISWRQSRLRILLPLSFSPLSSSLFSFEQNEYPENGGEWSMQRIYTYPARVVGGNRRKIHETGTYRGGKPRRNGGPILFSDVTTLKAAAKPPRPDLSRAKTSRNERWLCSIYGLRPPIGYSFRTKISDDLKIPREREI